MFCMAGSGLRAQNVHQDSLLIPQSAVSASEVPVEFILRIASGKVLAFLRHLLFADDIFVQGLQGKAASTESTVHFKK